MVAAASVALRAAVLARQMLEPGPGPLVQVRRVQMLEPGPGPLVQVRRVQVLEVQQEPLGAALEQVVAVGVPQQGAHLFALVVRVLPLVEEEVLVVEVEVLALWGVVSVVVPGLMALASVLPLLHPLGPVRLVSGNPETHHRRPLERLQTCLAPL